MKSLLLTIVTLAVSSAPAAFAKELDLKVVCSYNQSPDQVSLTIKGEAEDAGDHQYVRTDQNASYEIMRKDGRVFRLKTGEAYVFQSGWTILSMSIQDQLEDNKGDQNEAFAELASQLRLNKVLCRTLFLKVE